MPKNNNISGFDDNNQKNKHNKLPKKFSGFDDNNQKNLYARLRKDFLKNKIVRKFRSEFRSASSVVRKAIKEAKVRTYRLFHPAKKTVRKALFSESLKSKKLSESFKLRNPVSEKTRKLVYKTKEAKNARLNQLIERRQKTIDDITRKNSRKKLRSKNFGDPGMAKKLIKPPTNKKDDKLNIKKYGKVGLIGVGIAGAAVGVKHLLSKQEKGKHISVDLKKSTKFGNRKVKIKGKVRKINKLPQLRHMQRIFMRLFIYEKSRNLSLKFKRKDIQRYKSNKNYKRSPGGFGKVRPQGPDEFNKVKLKLPKNFKGVKNVINKLNIKKYGKVGLIGVGIAGAAIGVKHLLSKQEKSKRISVGLKKSAKFRNRKFKKR